MGLSISGKRKRVRRRVRSVVSGTPERPRLSVYRSNREIYAQLIDDVSGETILSASSKEKDFSVGGSRLEVAVGVGEILGKRALDKGIVKVCFDRGYGLYHGRIRSLADGARKAGLKF